MIQKLNEIDWTELGLPRKLSEVVRALRILQPYLGGWKLAHPPARVHCQLLTRVLGQRVLIHIHVEANNG